METRLEVIKSIMGDSIEKARATIEFWHQYIQATQEELVTIEQIASTIDSIEPCPICGGDMINVGKIIKRRYLIRHEYGGEHLKDYLGMTNDYRIVPTGYECQRCGIFQMEPDIELKYEWMPGTSNRFAASVFSAYPFIQKIAAGHFNPTTTYLFFIDDQWYTFGDLMKQEVADRLHLTNTQAPKNREVEKGYIYLIRASTGHYKIGRTKDISNRFNFFVVKLPFEIDLIHHFEAEDMRKAEAELHEKYKGKRVNGEWFDLDSQDVEEIKGISEIRLSRI